MVQKKENTITCWLCIASKQNFVQINSAFWALSIEKSGPKLKVFSGNLPQIAIARRHYFALAQCFSRVNFPGNHGKYELLSLTLQCTNSISMQCTEHNAMTM